MIMLWNTKEVGHADFAIYPLRSIPCSYLYVSTCYTIMLHRFAQTGKTGVVHCLVPIIAKLGINERL